MEDEAWDSIKIDDMLFAFSRKDEIIHCWTWRCFLPNEFDDRIREGAKKAKEIHHAKTLKERLDF